MPSSQKIAGLFTNKLRPIYQNVREYVSVEKCKCTNVQYIIQSLILRHPPLWLVTGPYEKKVPTFCGVLATATTRKTRKIRQSERKDGNNNVFRPRHGRYLPRLISESDGSMDSMRPCPFIKKDSCLGPLRADLKKVRGSDKKGE